MTKTCMARHHTQLHGALWSDKPNQWSARGTPARPDSYLRHSSLRFFPHLLWRCRRPLSGGRCRVGRLRTRAPVLRNEPSGTFWKLLVGFHLRGASGSRWLSLEWSKTEASVYQQSYNDRGHNPAKTSKRWYSFCPNIHQKWLNMVDLWHIFIQT